MAKCINSIPMACLEVSRNLRKTSDRDKAMALSYLPKFESIQKQISKYVSMTLEHGKVPTDEGYEDAVNNSGGCCGNGESGSCCS